MRSIIPSVQVGDVRLAYEERGTGIPLLLVHGYPLDRTMWQPQLEALAAHRRVIAVDLRGHGESVAGEAPASMDRFAEDLVGLLAILGIPDVVFCGLSMGGHVAFAFLRRHVGRLRALVLADTHP